MAWSGQYRAPPGFAGVVMDNKDRAHDHAQNRSLSCGKDQA